MTTKDWLWWCLAIVFVAAVVFQATEPSDWDKCMQRCEICAQKAMAFDGGDSRFLYCASEICRTGPQAKP